MKSFFYPLYNQDFTFENIFSTESISPPRFYKYRKFGIEYWPKLLPQQLDTAIVLYDEPPLFDVPKSFGDTIKYILEIKESAIDRGKLFELKKGVSCYLSTIYLAKDNFKILFFSERDRKLTISRSQQSLPTKDVTKFMDNFQFIDNKVCRAYDSEDLVGVNFEINPREVESDRKINFYKGLLYGLSAGYLTSSVPQELALKKRLREIKNRFAELKNRIGNQHVQLPFGKPKERPSGISLLAKELDILLDHTRSLFVGHFPSQTASKDELSKFLMNRHPNYLRTIESAEQFLDFTRLADIINERSDFDRIEELYFSSSQSKPVAQVFRSLKALLKEYAIQANKSSSKADRLDIAFKNNLSVIESFLDLQIEHRSINNDLDLSKIRYNFSSNSIDINGDILNLGKAQSQEFEILINIILKHPKPGKSIILSESLFGIIDEATFSLSNVRNSGLFDYYTNQTNSFSLDATSSEVVKNFSAFIFNADSLEKLAAYNQAKEIQNQWISYAFWSVFNGFASISGNFLRPIYVKGNPIADSINQTLKEYIHNSSSIKIELAKSENRQFNKMTFSQSEAYFRNFYDLYIRGKYDIDFATFLQLTTIEDFDFFVEVVSREFGITEKESSKLANSLSEFLRSNELFSE